MRGAGIRRLAGKNAGQQSGKQTANGREPSLRTSLLSSSQESFTYRTNPLAGGESVGAEFMVSRNDGLSSSERVVRFASNYGRFKHGKS
jgi:hypothetical protein